VSWGGGKGGSIEGAQKKNGFSDTGGGGVISARKEKREMGYATMWTKKDGGVQKKTPGRPVGSLFFSGTTGHLTRIKTAPDRWERGKTLNELLF